MTTKEVAQICGVTDECIRQNAKVIGVELGDRWHPHEWTDDEVKKVQLALMKNQTTRGNMTTETVSKVTQVNLGEGLAEYPFTQTFQERRLYWSAASISSKCFRQDKRDFRLETNKKYLKKF